MNAKELLAALTGKNADLKEVAGIDGVNGVYVKTLTVAEHERWLKELLKPEDQRDELHTARVFALQFFNANGDYFFDYQDEDLLKELGHMPWDVAEAMNQAFLTEVQDKNAKNQ